MPAATDDEPPRHLVHPIPTFSRTGDKQCRSENNQACPVRCHNAWSRIRAVSVLIVCASQTVGRHRSERLINHAERAGPLSTLKKSMDTHSNRCLVKYRLHERDHSARTAQRADIFRVEILYQILVDDCFDRAGRGGRQVRYTRKTGKRQRRSHKSSDCPGRIRLRP